MPCVLFCYYIEKTSIRNQMTFNFRLFIIWPSENGLVRSNHTCVAMSRKLQWHEYCDIISILDQYRINCPSLKWAISWGCKFLTNATPSDSFALHPMPHYCSKFMILQSMFRVHIISRFSHALWLAILN